MTDTKAEPLAPDDPLTPEDRQWVIELVDKAPPLTDQQKHRIAQIFLANGPIKPQAQARLPSRCPSPGNLSASSAG